MDSPPRCVICGTRQQLLRCAKCKTVFYCSIAHQHMDWAQHKPECRRLARQKNNHNNNSSSNNIARIHHTGGGAAASTLQQQTLPPPPQQHHQHQQRTHSLIRLGSNEHEIMSIGAAQAVSPQSPQLHQKQQEQQNGFHHADNDAAGGGPSPQQLMPPPPSPQQQPLFAPPFNSLNNRHERTLSYQIGRAAGGAHGLSIETPRYDELCQLVISDLNEYGMSVIDDFLGQEHGLKVLNEVQRMYGLGVFRDGQLVNDLMDREDTQKIRGDKITWVQGVEPECLSVGYLINQIDAVICKANIMHNNGKLGNYNIKERTKAMVACYPGSGTHYVMHVDNPNKDGRVITAIYYLNVNWDVERSGGVLRIFPDIPEHGHSCADIEPKFDRLIFFWSDKRNPHEVQPAHRTRYAITVWYFDAEEREAALQDAKYKNSLRAATTRQTPLPLAPPPTITTATTATTNTADVLVATTANNILTNSNTNSMVTSNSNSAEICT